MDDLIMVRGDTRTFDFSDIDDATGQAFDLNGAVVQWAVDGLFTKTSADDIEVDASSGEILATVYPDDTQDIPERREYHYDVQVTKAGVVTTARRGLFIVTPDVDTV